VAEGEEIQWAKLSSVLSSQMRILMKKLVVYSVKNSNLGKTAAGAVASIRGYARGYGKSLTIRLMSVLYEKLSSGRMATGPGQILFSPKILSDEEIKRFREEFLKAVSNRGKDGVA